MKKFTILLNNKYKIPENVVNLPPESWENTINHISHVLKNNVIIDNNDKINEEDYNNMLLKHKSEIERVKIDIINECNENNSLKYKQQHDKYVKEKEETEEYYNNTITLLQNNNKKLQLLIDSNEIKMISSYEMKMKNEVDQRNRTINSLNDEIERLRKHNENSNNSLISTYNDIITQYKTTSEGYKSKLNDMETVIKQDTNNKLNEQKAYYEEQITKYEYSHSKIVNELADKLKEKYHNEYQTKIIKTETLLENKEKEILMIQKHNESSNNSLISMYNDIITQYKTTTEEYKSKLNDKLNEQKIQYEEQKIQYEEQKTHYEEQKIQYEYSHNKIVNELADKLKEKYHNEYQTKIIKTETLLENKDKELQMIQKHNESSNNSLISKYNDIITQYKTTSEEYKSKLDDKLNEQKAYYEEQLTKNRDEYEEQLKEKYHNEYQMKIIKTETLLENKEKELSIIINNKDNELQMILENNEERINNYKSELQIKNETINNLVVNGNKLDEKLNEINKTIAPAAKFFNRTGTNSEKGIHGEMTIYQLLENNPVFNKANITYVGNNSHCGDIIFMWDNNFCCLIEVKNKINVTINDYLKFETDIKMTKNTHKVNCGIIVSIVTSNVGFVNSKSSYEIKYIDDTPTIELQLYTFDMLEHAILMLYSLNTTKKISNSHDVIYKENMKDSIQNITDMIKVMKSNIEELDNIKTNYQNQIHFLDMKLQKIRMQQENIKQLSDVDVLNLNNNLILYDTPETTDDNTNVISHVILQKKYNISNPYIDTITNVEIKNKLNALLPYGVIENILKKACYLINKDIEVTQVTLKNECKTFRLINNLKVFNNRKKFIADLLDYCFYQYKKTSLESETKVEPIPKEETKVEPIPKEETKVNKILDEPPDDTLVKLNIKTYKKNKK